MHIFGNDTQRWQTELFYKKIRETYITYGMFKTAPVLKPNALPHTVSLIPHCAKPATLRREATC